LHGLLAGKKEDPPASPGTNRGNLPSGSCTYVLDSFIVREYGQLFLVVLKCFQHDEASIWEDPPTRSRPIAMSRADVYHNPWAKVLPFHPL